MAWDHVRARLPGATERELADAVADLLTRAHAGPERPASTSRRRKDRQVTARTRAVPRAHDGPRPGLQSSADGTGEDAPAEQVAPLPVFDPFTEARKRW
jgi:hypothetical protein